MLVRKMQQKREAEKSFAKGEVRDSSLRRFNLSCWHGRWKKGTKAKECRGPPEDDNSPRKKARKKMENSVYNHIELNSVNNPKTSRKEHRPGSAFTLDSCQKPALLCFANTSEIQAL